MYSVYQLTLLCSITFVALCEEMVKILSPLWDSFCMLISQGTFYNRECDTESQNLTFSAYIWKLNIDENFSVGALRKIHTILMGLKLAQVCIFVMKCQIMW